MTALQMSPELRQLHWLKYITFLEGATLVALVFIAVPIKHIIGIRFATNIMGPIHGLAFCLYIWMLIQAVASGALPNDRTLKMILAAFIPLGSLASLRIVKKRIEFLTSNPIWK